MSSVCLVNGSLRGKKASSLVFLNDIELRLRSAGIETSRLGVSAAVRYKPEFLQRLSGHQALIFVFPLHNYAVPGALFRLLEDYMAFAGNTELGVKTCRVYAIVNCGFPKPEVNNEAVRVIKNFCRRLSLNWRFAVCIGTGPVVAVTSRLPLFDKGLKKAYGAIVKDIIREGAVPPDFMVKPVVPEFILVQIKNYYERKGGMIEQHPPPTR